MGWGAAGGGSGRMAAPGGPDAGHDEVRRWRAADWAGWVGMAVLRPPVELVSSRLVRAVPVSRPGRQLAFEPKYDGWRAALFSALGVLQSRRGTNLASRFPEIMDVASELGDVVLDGEIVATREGRIDFGALSMSARSRAEAGVGISFVAFDLLAEGWRDRRPDPYRLRRAGLERLFTTVGPPLWLTPSTTQRDAALEWMRPEFAAAGIEGCVAKLVESAYRPGPAGAWVKVRQMMVVDAVVVGVTGSAQRPREVVLARRDAAGELRRIGLSLPLAPPLRYQIGRRVRLTGEPGRQISGAFGQGRAEYRPVRPELVVEVEAEASVATFTSRLRPRVHRPRPDLTAADLEP
jgi:ATP-dependent DNA ligase